MKEFSIDLDILKLIFYCPTVIDLQWRISASGKGFHFRWTCTKARCKHCSRIEKEFDDPNRFRRDKKRKSYRARVLWDSKGGRLAGPWRKVKR